MTLVTYPLDHTDYSAEDAALFHSTRTTGIYAGDDFTFSLTGADNTITLGVGLAWMRLARFRGVAAALKTEAAVDMGLPDSVYPRIDHIVLQYDANKNTTEVVVKKGTAASEPQPPERSTSEALFEIHLLQVRREPSATAITAADVTDLRLDSNYCGLMADSVTDIDTTAINAQVKALIAQLRTELEAAKEGTILDGKIEMGVLWENLDPDAEFPPQDITIPGLADQSVWEYVLLSSQRASLFFENKQCSANLGFYGVEKGEPYFYNRTIYVTSDGIAQMGDNYHITFDSSGATAEVNNRMNRPLVIVGIRGVKT